MERLADALQAIDPDPCAVTREERPYAFERRDGVHQVRVAMPFAAKGEGHVGLPRSIAAPRQGTKISVE